MRINEYEIVSDVGSEDFTTFITREIQFNWTWIITPDELSLPEHPRQEEERRLISDSGLLIKSYNDKYSYEENNTYYKLNCYADYLYDSILRKSKWEYENPNLRRYYWNYYNVGSTGVFHKDYHPDIEDKPHASILYNFSNDGGTIIKEGEEEIFIPSVSREAIIFNSFANHRGVGPSKEKQRFCLNIAFTYSDRKLK